jgi:hypothetical protein
MTKAVSRFIATPAMRIVSFFGSRACAIERFGGGSDQAPDLATIVALDAEVRAAFASGPVPGASTVAR